MRKFNFNIETDDNDSLSKSVYKNDKQKSLVVDRFGFVDLDLPSGTLWAKFNLGVDPDNLNYAKDWWGMYYAWGELDNALSNYDYKFIDDNGKLKKYCLDSTRGKVDNKSILELKDDIAYVSTKNEVYTQRIPNKDQLKELLNNTTERFINDYNGIKGLNVVILKSKINENELVIPLCGCVHKGTLKNDDNNYGGFWLADLLATNNLLGEADDSEWANAFIAHKDYKVVNISNRKRIVGLPIRGILYKI